MAKYRLRLKLDLSAREIGNGLDTNSLEADTNNPSGFEKYYPSKLDILYQTLAGTTQYLSTPLT